jgi:hypothetical protein
VLAEEGNPLGKVIHEREAHMANLYHSMNFQKVGSKITSVSTEKNLTKLIC